MGFGGRLYDLQQSLAGYAQARLFLEYTQYWDRENIERLQYRNLLALLNHCSRMAPYYRQLFAQIGFEPRRDFQSLADLSRIPILTKELARINAPELKAGEFPGSSVIERTSGSTGVPFEIAISTEQIVLEKAAVWRHWRWAGYRFRDPMAIVRTYVPKDGQPLITHDRTRNFRYYSAYHLDETNAQEYLKDIRNFKAQYLRGYPSSLYILANFKESSGIELPPLQAIFTASETLTAQQRQTIERAFGSRIFDWYGLSEQVVTANECAAHAGLHQNSEYGYWELQPRPYLAENERMIVGTNFRNYAMPLLRYETGDIAIVGDTETCSCGRSLPLIKAIAGRKDDIITTPDGAYLPAVNFYSLFREFRSVERFQMVQWEKDLVEIKIKSADLSPTDREDILRELQLRLGQRMKIKISLNSEFMKNPQGKRRPVMSLVKIEESQ